jgi:hypothetical protein
LQKAFHLGYSECMEVAEASILDARAEDMDRLITVSVFHAYIHTYPESVLVKQNELQAFSLLLLESERASAWILARLLNSRRGELVRYYRVFCGEKEQEVESGLEKLVRNELSANFARGVRTIQ